MAKYAYMKKERREKDSSANLEEFRLEASEGTTDTEVEFLPSIDSTCLIFIRLYQILERAPYIGLRYGAKMRSIYPL